MDAEFHDNNFSNGNLVLEKCKEYTVEREGDNLLGVQCAAICRDWFDLKTPQRANLRLLNFSMRSFFALLKSLSLLEGFQVFFPSLDTNLKMIDAHWRTEFRVDRKTQQIKDSRTGQNRCQACAIFWQRRSASMRACPRDFCEEVCRYTSRKSTT